MISHGVLGSGIQLALLTAGNCHVRVSCLPVDDTACQITAIHIIRQGEINFLEIPRLDFTQGIRYNTVLTIFFVLM